MLVFSRARSRFWSILFIALLGLVPLLHVSPATADTMTLNPALLVKDLVPGTESASPKYLSVFGNRLIFAANNGSLLDALSISDGTLPGTFTLKAVTLASPVVTSGGIGFFAASDAEYNVELWRTDGTAAGTQVVTELVSGLVGSYPNHLIDLNGTLFFIATTGDGVGNYSPGLWKSDGTAAGTTLVKPRLDNISLIVKANNKLFLLREVDNSAQLWVSDGTADGTYILKSFLASMSVSTKSVEQRANASPRIPGFPFTYFLTAVGDRLFFRANDGVHGIELWQSDGTVAGTKLVKDLTPGIADSAPEWFASFGGKLFFAMAEGLWQSDGTDAGTSLVKQGLGQIIRLYPAGNQLYISNFQSVLWRSDGTTAGTVPLKDLGPAGLYDFAAYNNKVFFTANYGVQGSELWQSDGTPAGTQLVKKTIPMLDELGPDLTVVNGRLFFHGYTAQHGYELWSSDGTEAGTQMVKDINTKPASSNPAIGSVTCNERIFFSLPSGSLWVSDGTAEGTKQVQNIDCMPNPSPTIPAEFMAWQIPAQVAMNDQLFFLVISGDTNTTGLWQTDGTVAGTKQIKALYPGSELVNLNNTLYFSARIEEGNWQLWQSDGTTAGTISLKDFGQIPIPVAPYNFITLNGSLYFLANEEVHGFELWKSDGTPEGTTILKDIHPGTVGSAARQIILTQDRFFFIANDGIHGDELWTSDGTPDGTFMLKDIHPNSTDASAPSSLTRVGNRLFFVADEVTSSGIELWTSDGTTDGTQLFKDINPGPANGWPTALTTITNIMLFVATDGNGQRTLWRSDGTVTGTYSLQAITPASNTTFVKAGNNIFFSADDGTTGYELWRIPLTENGLLLDTPALVGAPSGGVGRIPIEFGNQSNTPQTNAILTVTLDERLTYLDSTGPITPTVTANTLVWSLPDLGVLSEGEVDIRVELPADPLGTRYPVTLILAAGPAGTGADSETSRTIDVMAADQNYLPIIGR